jgi:hypothetical protein
VCSVYKQPYIGAEARIDILYTFKIKAAVSRDFQTLFFFHQNISHYVTDSHPRILLQTTVKIAEIFAISYR